MAAISPAGPGPRSHARGSAKEKGKTMALDAPQAERKTRGAAGGGTFAAEELRGYIERIERLEEERKALGGDIRDIYAEAKGRGFDVKVMRALIRIRKQEPAVVEEQESLLDVYRRALGM